MMVIRMETVRPTLDMMFRIFPGSETWIFNDCAIAYKHGRFTALIVRRFAEGKYVQTTYYGFVHDLKPIHGGRSARNAMSEACAGFCDCPKVFDRIPSWDLVEEGHRYVRSGS